MSNGPISAWSGSSAYIADDPRSVSITMIRPFGPAKPRAILSAVIVLPLPAGPSRAKRSFLFSRTARRGLKFIAGGSRRFGGDRFGYDNGVAVFVYFKARF